MAVAAVTKKRAGQPMMVATEAACMLLRCLPKPIHIHVQSEEQFLNFLTKDGMPSVHASFSQLVGILGSTLGPIKETPT